MKRIFITGVSSGIGKELALQYAKQKCIIGISARRHELLNDIAKDCNNLGSKTHVYQLDVQNRKKCEKVISQFLKISGGIDCVIANAGIGGDDNLFSGTSKNIISAIVLANKLNCKTIGLSGKSGGEFNNVCSLNIVVASDNTPRIQEMHILIGHVICDLIEKEFSKSK